MLSAIVACVIALRTIVGLCIALRVFHTDAQSNSDFYNIAYHIIL